MIDDYMDKQVRRIRDGKEGTVIRGGRSFPFDCYVRWEGGYESYCDFHEIELIED